MKLLSSLVVSTVFSDLIILDYKHYLFIVLASAEKSWNKRIVSIKDEDGSSELVRLYVFF